MKGLMIAATAVSLLGSPSFAQSLAPPPGTGEAQANRATSPQQFNRRTSRAHRGALSAYGSVSPSEPVGTARDTALHDCNAAAAKTYPTRDSNWPILAYRACMAEHGQPE